jgi:hypothetical protein
MTISVNEGGGTEEVNLLSRKGYPTGWKFSVRANEKLACHKCVGNIVFIYVKDRGRL